MSYRRPNYGGGGGGGGGGSGGNPHRHNNTRNPPRERNVIKQKPNPEMNTSDSRALQMLQVILNEERDMPMRNNTAITLLKVLEESRQQDGLAARQEQSLLLDRCLHHPSIRHLFDSTKIPVSLKQSMVSIMSGLACYTRLDILFSWIFEHMAVWSNVAEDPARERDWKTWLLKLLKQVLLDGSSEGQLLYRQLKEMSPNIMAGVIYFLDSMDIPDYLPFITDVLDLMAERFPDAFSQRFSDIIDLLVGWNTDVGTSDSKRQVIVDAFGKYGSYWIKYLPFTFELLTHFLSDIHGFVRDQTSLKEREESKDAKKSRDTCKTLFTCYSTILAAIVPLLVNNGVFRNMTLAETSFDVLLPGTIALAIDSLNAGFNEDWTESCIQNMIKITEYNPVRYRAYQLKVFEYLIAIIDHNQPISSDSYIKYMIKFLSVSKSDIDEAVLMQLSDPKTSPLFALCTEYSLKDNSNTVSGILVVFRFITRLPSTPKQLQETVVNHLKELLLQNLHTVNTSSIFQDNNNQYALNRTLRNFESNGLSTYLDDLSTGEENNKAETRTATENVLFFEYLLLDSAIAWPTVRFENVLESIRVLLTLWHRKCNDAFDASLQIFINYWRGVQFATSKPKELQLLTDVIRDLLDNWTQVSLQVRQLIGSFMVDFIKVLFTSKLTHSQVKEMMTSIIESFLQCSGSERNSDVKQKVLNLVTFYCQTFGSAEIVNLVLEKAQISVNDPHSNVQQASKELLTALNPYMISDVCKPHEDVVSSIQSIIIATPHTGSFRPVHYEIVMKHLGMGDHLVGSAVGMDDIIDDRNKTDWVRRLLHHCDTLSSMKSVNTFNVLQEDINVATIVDLINNNEPLLCYWALWESARYCMLSRLRTPFGGPQQTFAAFEKMLSSLLSQNDDSQIKHLEHLLLLLDRLEVQIYNASDGCVTGAMPAVPRSSIIFFRTNKKTCHDYFLRIRPNLIDGAKMVRNNHLLISHIMRMLLEMESNIPDKLADDPLPWFTQINRYLCDFVEACIREKYTDTIWGMNAWFKRLIKRLGQNIPRFKETWRFEGFIGPFSKKEESYPPTSQNGWFKVAACFASSRDENAIKLLNGLKERVPRDSYGIIDMLDRQAIDYYSCLDNYEHLDQLLSEPDSNVYDKYIINTLKAFNSDTILDQESIAQELGKFVKHAPLESCLALSRLDQFHQYKQDNEDIEAVLVDRMMHVLKTDIFKNRQSLLELQLYDSSWETNFASVKCWTQLPPRNVLTVHDLSSETKHWARLSNKFESLYHANGGDTQLDAYRASGQMLLHASKVARRQENIALAESFIEKAVENPYSKYAALYERAKILFAKNDFYGAINTINTVLVNVTSMRGYDTLKSKSYLKVARYLKGCPEADAATIANNLDKILFPVPKENLQSYAEVCVDYALVKSIEKNLTDGRPWFEYAAHNYKQGWKILDEVLRTESSVSIVIWAKSTISEYLSELDRSTVDVQQLEKSVMNAFLKHIASSDENTLSINGNLASSITQIDASFTPDIITGLIDVFKTLQQVVLSKFDYAAQAYFRYLSLDIHKDPNDNDGINSTSMVITATLRLLRILTKFGETLQQVFTEHVSMIRVDLWKCIIPQLFAQLNHPSDFVRQITSTLIGRICDEYPREIIYDVIVGSTSSKTNRDTKQCLNDIASRMMGRNELLWVSTRRMAEELEKITVLVEEKWLNKIASLQFDVMQQFSKLDKEVERLKQKKMDEEQFERQFRETYDSMMKFVLTSIDKLMEVTAQESMAPTPHEMWFEKTFGKQLLHAYNLLQKPTSSKTYRQGWEAFQQLHRQLMAENHKVRILELAQVSPYLSELRNTAIGIPGYHEGDNACFIDTFGQSMIILPTKTKPKKLDLLGTDGRKYSYLFKGLEDLHLDERIMQLLNTTNGLLSEDGTTTTTLRGLRARTYAVIPLSDHSGMIQWVNEATPLFALFKKWQKRESATHMLLTNDRPNEAYMRSLLQRPTETFTQKVTAALKQEKLRVTANRRYWPKHILKKVYLELVKETPGDLLEKEIWYSSSNATEWFKKSTSFARSLAVTSMIGYIIGLGDRHLDNMMIDFKSGEIIHIDYNVCFEKGKRLRVPELVPYRLTQNLYGALGVLGTDGPFRVAAEETLRVLRKNKEVLITLLDAFVYDPLVDWESEAEEAGHRQMMELQANLWLIAARVVEKQQEYDAEQVYMQKTLTMIQSKLQIWQQTALLEAESLDDDEASDEDEVDASLVSDSNNNNAPSTEENIANETSYMLRLPTTLLQQVDKQLNGIASFASSARSSSEGLSPLLQSIIIIETDADNELRPAQQSAKLALDSVSAIINDLSKLSKQTIEKQNYESDWTYAQLMELLQSIEAAIRNYFSSLKILEEFGQESTKAVTATHPTTATTTEENESTENIEESKSDEQHAVIMDKETPNQLTSAKQSSNSHALKIMKRIRSKLEGDDLGINHKMSIAEQVARTIDQATSVDNLCLMYEGWTSWV
ncbi:hypothetical protein K501DRAFT_229661 [Backusella circina FSU 941]|nr:hypothetical protein K501DRAFT_229661 [Backusella circina FSU 941]